MVPYTVISPVLVLPAGFVIRIPAPLRGAIAKIGITSALSNDFEITSIGDTALFDDLELDTAPWSVAAYVAGVPADAVLAPYRIVPRITPDGDQVSDDYNEHWFDPPRPFDLVRQAQQNILLWGDDAGSCQLTLSYLDLSPR